MDNCYLEIKTALLQASVLKQTDLSEKTMLTILHEDLSAEEIEQLLQEDYICALDLAHVLSPVSHRFDTLEGMDLLQYIYMHTLSALFPENFMGSLNPDLERVRIIFCEIFRILLHQESLNRPFLYTKHFQLASPNEALDQNIRDEYIQFLTTCHSLYLYEFLRISTECTSFDTLGHVAGVHYVATSMGNQLKKAGTPVDLALLSGAAASHDIGKFGCRQSEMKRVPYLHYFYTEQCTNRFGMPTIGHIAANHSTWDLELENLSVESLLLIYADFRVKSTRDASGKESVHIYTLKESFDVILNKLDNVDEAKARRYHVVYDKLKDFEDYCVHLGVDTTLTKDCLTPEPKKDPNLMNARETIQNLKYTAIEHNLYVMNRLSNESTLGNVLEAARTDRDWKNIRAYINIFDEYYTYMTQKQKSLTIHFLFELLMHREGDIRRQSAVLIGKIIAHYDRVYRKELPADMNLPPDPITSYQIWNGIIRDIIHPDHKITSQHKHWLGYTLKRIMESLLMECSKERQQTYIRIFLDYFQQENLGEWGSFVLIDSSTVLPFEVCSREQIVSTMQSVNRMIAYHQDEISLCALRLCDDLLMEDMVGDVIREEAKILVDSVTFQSHSVSIDYLLYKTKRDYGFIPAPEEEPKKLFFENDDMISEIFLENLKMATPWIFKVVNIRLLKDIIASGSTRHLLHIATHFTNLIKVSERVTVRKRAGIALVSMIELLTLDQRNEIAVELIRGLEIGEYQFSKYIPDYLGQIVLYLHPKECDEALYEFEKYMASTNDKVVTVTLQTLAVMLRHFTQYQNRFPTYQNQIEKQHLRILGMLSKGLANYHEQVSLEAFNVIGHELLGSPDMTLTEKGFIFSYLYKKISTLLPDQSDKELSFFNRAAALNHVYRFISQYRLESTVPLAHEKQKVAFFPGTFDPFSLGHKGIVEVIRDMGFEVYLALDEFSWSKKTQPKLLRRKIVTMSVADSFDVYVFPDHIPINIGNPDSLAELEAIFSDKDLYLVTGSDVIANASAYQAPASPGSVHHMNHIIFCRGRQAADEIDTSCITGDVQILALSSELEDVSSTRIRNNIDYNRDISNLIDATAQNFIYDNGLYMREPQYKNLLASEDISFDIIHDSSLGDEQAVVLKSNTSQTLLVALTFHEVRNADLYQEFRNTDIVSYVRHFASGKTVVITNILQLNISRIANKKQAILTEALTYFLRQEYTYALCHFKNREQDDLSKIISLFQRHGFLKVPFATPEEYVSLVDMRYPLLLVHDAAAMIKAPFHHNTRVLNHLKTAHERLQLALTELYPQNLVLSFDSQYTQRQMMDLITDENHVPHIQEKKRVLGTKMCVPFGNILRDTIVPNTVTKALHTTKVYEPDAASYSIEQSLNYPDLVSQVKTIKAFHRPVILVDDTLHNADRMHRIGPLLQQEGITVDKVIVGIMSGSGKDQMEIAGQPVRSLYFIPNLRSWVTESSLYPFIGGDRVRREELSFSGIVPAINMILPYVASRLPDVSWQTQYHLSEVCLTNAMELFDVLEEEYQMEFERNLTLNRLTEVLKNPTCPDMGLNITLDMNQPPSVYIGNHLEQLYRMRNLRQ